MTTTVHVTAESTTSTAPHQVQLIIGILPLLLGIELLGWLVFLPIALSGHSDFRQLYTGGYMLRSGHGHDLYDYDTQKRFEDSLVSSEQIALPINHLTYEELLFVPFSLMKYRTAYLAFLAFNVVLVGWCVWLFRPHSNELAHAWRWLPAAMFASFFPVTATLMQGQDSIILLILLIAAMAAVDRGWDMTAGVLVGLGLFKFQVVLPIALLFLIWRRRRFAAGFLLAGLTVLASSVRGLTFGLTNGHLSHASIQVCTIVLSAFLILWLGKATPRGLRSADALSLAITASILLSYHIFLYDLSILLIPIAITVNNFRASEAAASTLERGTAWLAAVLFIIPICNLFMGNYKYLLSLPICVFLFALLFRYRRDYRTASSRPRSDLVGA
jgi:hypothetical protein